MCIQSVQDLQPSHYSCENLKINTTPPIAMPFTASYMLLWLYLMSQCYNFNSPFNFYGV